MIFFLLLWTTLSQAAIRDFGERPEPHSLCRMDRVNACIQDHQRAGEAETNAVAVIDEKLRLLAGDRASLTADLSALGGEMQEVETSLRMTELELEAPAKPASKEVFPAGPSPTEIFFLRGEPDEWPELHPAERRFRLSSLAISLRARAQDLGPTQQKIATEISALDGQNALLQQERAGHFRAAASHASMCGYGCREDFCRTL